MRRRRTAKRVGLAACVAIVCLMRDAIADSTHYFYGGTGNTRIVFGDGANYMGPGHGFVVRTDGDVSGAERMAVPIVLGPEPAIVTNFVAGLGGAPGSSRGVNFGVCITRAAANACGPVGTFCSTASGAGTGVFCQAAGSQTGCTDKVGYLAVCDQDRLMVKSMKINATEPAASREKFSFQVVTFDGGSEPLPTNPPPPPTPTRTPTQTPTRTPTRTPTP